MKKELTQQEIEEQELANKVLAALFKERGDLEYKRSRGVTLEKNEYIGDRTDEIENEISKLKSKKAE